MINKNLKFASALVTCGLDKTYCTPCDLWTLASNIVDFLVKPPSGLAFPVLVLALLIGGIVWATSAGNLQRIELGKKVITSSIIGIFIAFGGFLIVDTIIKTMAEPSGSFRGVVLPWNKIAECPAPIVTPPPTDGDIDPKFINDFEANKANANLLTDSGITFGGGGSCVNTNGQNVSAATNLAELQSGEGLTVCQSGCSATFLKTCQKSSNTLDPELLAALFAAKQSTMVGFTITSLTTGDHAQNSDHYQGAAVDIVPNIPTQENYLALRTQLRILSGPGNRVECEDNKGNIVSNCGQGTTHLHATIK